MRLRPKLVLIFSAALVAILGLALIGFPRLFARISESQLYALARTVGAYLAHDLESLPFGGNEAAFEREIDSRFEFIQRLGEDTGNFRINKVLLIDEAFRVEVGHPESELGVDYSGHEDIRQAFDSGEMRVVLETSQGADGRRETDVDVVRRLALADGDLRILELKLDFTGTLALLGAQYRRVQLYAFGILAAGLVLLVAFLLYGLRRAVLLPILEVSRAMEEAGQGNLEARAAVDSRDEIGDMARRFGEMLRGLKERFELERYVSRSTASAARARVAEGERPVERKRLTVFFSDVRGFTAYSEHTDPARVVAVLNVLLGLQEEIVAACGGEVDKFVGDETMAVFQRPVDAAAAAFAIRERTLRMAGEIDGLALGIGIHLGELVEGDIGSPRLMNHTVIGDTVNAAARLQAAAGPGEILVSAAVAEDRGVRTHFALTELGAIKVKGKLEAIEVWRLVGRRGEAGEEG